MRRRCMGAGGSVSRLAEGQPSSYWPRKCLGPTHSPPTSNRSRAAPASHPVRTQSCPLLLMKRSPRISEAPTGRTVDRRDKLDFLFKRTIRFCIYHL
uniref:Uncharacterized protein n=1 Tax=Anguilla anguilla TaxID=7936 RepID=A0A0E9X4P4_ANGAN